MNRKVLVINKNNFHKRTMALARELAAIIPGAQECSIEDFSPDIPDSNAVNEIDAQQDIVTVKFTEDIGPQFITFQSSTHQFVFKIIEFKSREDMGIADTIKRENSQLVLSNFTSDVGMAVAEFLMTLFPVSIESNQVINFTVHKDFLFFRMYRFCIREKGPVMEKVGPHLTLRLWRMTEYIGQEKHTHDFKKYVKNLNLL